LLLVSVSGHVLGVAPAVGWSDEDVLSYWEEMLLVPSA
jgi:hypothetical protein